MATLDFFLPLRPLVGLLARIVRRELGLTQSSDVPVPGGLGTVKSVFSRSVAAALGQSYANGNYVRREFAERLWPRIARFRFDGVDPPEVIDRAIRMTVNTAEDSLAFGPRAVQQEISDDNVAREAARDYEQLAAEYHRWASRSKEEKEFSTDMLSAPLWSEKPPHWWEMWPEPPDRWVDSLGDLCKPVWGSRELDDESLAYLVDFGLDGIEKNPDVIEPWKQTVSQLVTTATKKKVGIREAVSCCKVEP